MSKRVIFNIVFTLCLGLSLNIYAKKREKKFLELSSIPPLRMVYDKDLSKGKKSHEAGAHFVGKLDFFVETEDDYALSLNFKRKFKNDETKKRLSSRNTWKLINLDKNLTITDNSFYDMNSISGKIQTKDHLEKKEKSKTKIRRWRLIATTEVIKPTGEGDYDLNFALSVNQ